VISTLVLSGSSASAAFKISYVGGTVTAGGTGILNVFLSSDAPATPDVLDSFSSHFRITAVGGAVLDGLQFSPTQTESQLGDVSYVFNNDSFAEISSDPMGNRVGLVSTDAYYNDTYMGGDGTVSGSGVELDNLSFPFLLYSLDLDAALANAGDQFTVSLIDDGFTEFLDPDFKPLRFEGSSFDKFTITAGSSAAAVPEPATGVLFLVSFATAAWCWRRMPPVIV